MAWDVALPDGSRYQAPCRWRAVYEDLSEYDSDTHSIADLPEKGLQGLVIRDLPMIDGAKLRLMDFPVCRKDQYGILPDGLVRGTYRGTDIKSVHPDARVFDTRTISTKQFHLVEKSLGAWESRDPFPGWEKDIVGIRVWTSTEVFDTRGESDWGAWWANLPDDIQACTLYENWLTPEGTQQRQFVDGSANLYFAEAYGPVVATTDDDVSKVLSHHPNAVFKGRKNISRRNLAAIREAQTASDMF